MPGRQYGLQVNVDFGGDSCKALVNFLRHDARLPKLASSSARSPRRSRSESRLASFPRVAVNKMCLCVCACVSVCECICACVRTCVSGLVCGLCLHSYTSFIQAWAQNPRPEKYPGRRCRYLRRHRRTTKMTWRMLAQGQTAKFWLSRSKGHSQYT